MSDEHVESEALEAFRELREAVKGWNHDELHGFFDALVLGRVHGVVDGDDVAPVRRFFAEWHRALRRF